MREVVYTLVLCSFCIPALTGCSQRTLKWEQVTDNPRSWTYLSAKEARLKPPPPDANFPDERLLLIDVDLLSYDALSHATNGGATLAMPSDFCTMLVTGSVAQAAIPENLGKVLPVVVDRKMTIHFLSQTNGDWYSTNVLRTRVVYLQHSR